MKMNCRVIVMRSDGVWFIGPLSLVKKHEESKLFTDLDDVLSRVRDVICLAAAPVTQIRIVDEAWNE